MEYRAVCTSADKQGAVYKQFADEAEARKWALGAIGTEWSQIVIQKQNDNGDWESQPVASYKADH